MEDENHLNVEKLFQTLAKIIGDREGVSIDVKVTKKRDDYTNKKDATPPSK